MVGLGDTFAQLRGSVAALGKWGIYLGILLFVLLIIFYFVWNRRRWNLKVEFKLWRSGGEFLYTEWGKGKYNASAGNATLKRPGLMSAKYLIKGFNPTEMLQGSDTLTVIQVGPTTMMPVIPQSYQQVVNERGETALLMNIKADTTADNNWAAQTYTSLIDTYTIRNFLKDYGQWLGMGIVIAIILISQYVGVGMIIDRLK